MEKWIPISIKPTPEPREINKGPNIHCWCAIRYSNGNDYYLEHLSWNPFYCCWDNEDEESITLNAEVAYWQPMYVPELPHV